MFHRLGSWCHRHRLAVVVAWVVVLVGANALTGFVGRDFSQDIGLPSVESKAGLDLLDAEFGGQGAGESGTIVVQAARGIDDPSVRGPMEAYLARVDAIPGVDVSSPYTSGNERQVAPAAGGDGQVAYAAVEIIDAETDVGTDRLAEEITADAPEVDGLTVEYGGMMFATFEPPASELLGLAFAIVILILAFGSVLAMGLPIGVALAGVGVGAALIGLLSNVATVPEFATTLGVMIGLGVGIDYALFIVTRYREQLRAGHPVGEAIAIAIDTSGRAVAFAGLTVVISLLGMLLMGISFVSGLGLGAASVVAVTMVASLTLLPALLGFAGPRVERTRWRGLVAAGLVAVALVGAALRISPLLVGLPLAVVVVAAGSAIAPLRKEVRRRPPKPVDETIAYRWSRGVQRHPWAVAVVSTAALVVLALPVLGLRLGFSDQGNDPVGTTTRDAYDLLAEGFGPGFNGPLTVVTALPDGTSPEALAPVGAALATTPGVAFASPAIPNDPTSPTAVLWRVVPDTAPQEEATADLVRRLRSEVLPAAETVPGVEPVVTGSVAIQVDFSDYLASRLPIFFGVVLGLSFLLLMAVFRSLLVPLKAVIMNLLSIGAAYGIIVAVFQWGWGGSVIGIAGAPIEPFIPMMLFAIVFGLSMDYEVFLLSRIREEYDRTGDPHTSVADGLAATARVITAAAAIMVVVFGSFLLEDLRVIKLLGAGLAVAVLLDATVVRMLLVPATMELLGDRNWWLPGWLDRVLPRIDVEGHAATVGGDDDTPDPGPGGSPPDGPGPPRTPDDDRQLTGVG
ncbi:MAG: MMPL family transporter [Acidimicrobiales bacterium]|nr:MMPL family transporter [Acidimicrobiales bacterium]